MLEIRREVSWVASGRLRRRKGMERLQQQGKWESLARVEVVLSIVLA